MNIHPLWFFCIVLRLSLTYIVAKYNIKPVLLIISLGFLYKYITGSNMEQQLAKVFWHEFRIGHSLLYFGAFLTYGTKYSSMFLFIDVIFSIIYRYIYNM